MQFLSHIPVTRLLSETCDFLKALYRLKECFETNEVNLIYTVTAYVGLPVH